MRCDLRSAALCALLLALPAYADEASPASAPATQPETSGAADRRARFLLEQRSMLSDLLEQPTKIPPRRADEVLKLSIVDGHLAIEPAANIPDEACVPLADGRGVVVFRRMRVGPTGGETAFIESRYLRLHGDDATAPASTFIQLMTTPFGSSISLAEQTPEATTDAQLNDIRRDQSDDGGEPPSSKLLFSRRTELDENEPGAAEERDGRVQHTTPNFATLIEEQHDDVVSAMLEAFTSFRSVHALSGLTDAQIRQVLATDTPQSPEADREVAAILEKLKTNGVDAVEPIRKTLTKDNMPTAIALARADRHGWSADLSSLVDSVLADALPISQRAARRVLAAPTRLVDALYWPDPIVRKAIKARLSTTLSNTLLGEFDPEADPYTQTGRIEAIRAALLKPAAK